MTLSEEGLRDSHHATGASVLEDIRPLPSPGLLPLLSFPAQLTSRTPMGCPAWVWVAPLSAALLSSLLPAVDKGQLGASRNFIAQWLGGFSGTSGPLGFLLLSLHQDFSPLAVSPRCLPLWSQPCAVHLQSHKDPRHPQHQLPSFPRSLPLGAVVSVMSSRSVHGPSCLHN